MTSCADPELVIFLDTCTGEIVIEGVSCDRHQKLARPDSIWEFRTGLAYEDSVAAKIKSALTKRGVKVKGIREKCINISKDWLVQILAIVYSGLDQKASDRLVYLKNAADNNSAWKNNPGIELQKSKDKEYWNNVKRFNRQNQVRISSVNAAKRTGIKSLIVEDDPISRKVMFHYVSPLGECDLVYDGLEAVRAFTAAVDKGEHFDLVTLDIMMPGIDGHEVLKRIRRIEEMRGLDATKIIMTTALSGAKFILSAFREQCDAYLVKPIRKNKLMKCLHELNLLDQPI